MVKIGMKQNKNKKTRLKNERVFFILFLKM